MQQGILGSSFFVEYHARIDYVTSYVAWKQHRIPFKTVESTVVPSRHNIGFIIKVSNPEIKTGYLLRKTKFS